MAGNSKNTLDIVQEEYKRIVFDIPALQLKVKTTVPMQNGQWHGKLGQQSRRR